MTVSGRSECREAEEWLSEKYSGNQNILHLCAGNLSLSSSNGLLINSVVIPFNLNHSSMISFLPSLKTFASVYFLI